MKSKNKVVNIGHLFAPPKPTEKSKPEQKPESKKEEVKSFPEIKYRNILQTVAQMRYAQQRFFEKDAPADQKKKYLIESKQLEQAVDMRLGEVGITAIKN